MNGYYTTLLLRTRFLPFSSFSVEKGFIWQSMVFRFLFFSLLPLYFFSQCFLQLFFLSRSYLPLLPFYIPSPFSVPPVVSYWPFPYLLLLQLPCRLFLHLSCYPVLPVHPSNLQHYHVVQSSYPHINPLGCWFFLDAVADFTDKSISWVNRLGAVYVCMHFFGHTVVITIVYIQIKNTCFFPVIFRYNFCR